MFVSFKITSSMLFILAIPELLAYIQVKSIVIGVKLMTS